MFASGTRPWNCRTPVLGLGVDSTFTWDNKNNKNKDIKNNKNPHLRGDKEQGIWDKGQRSKVNAKGPGLRVKSQGSRARVKGHGSTVKGHGSRVKG